MSAKLEYLLRLGDNDVVLAQRLGEWVGHGPVLEPPLEAMDEAIRIAERNTPAVQQM